MRPVTSTEYTVGKTNTFHSDGLFSEIIFGAKDSVDRKKNYSFIELNCKILHPALFKPLERLNKKILLAISGEAAYNLDKSGFLVEDKTGNINSLNSVIKNIELILMSRKEDTDYRIALRNMMINYIAGIFEL